MVTEQRVCHKRRYWRFRAAFAAFTLSAVDTAVEALPSVASFTLSGVDAAVGALLSDTFVAVSVLVCCAGACVIADGISGDAFLSGALAMVSGLFACCKASGGV